MDEHKHKILVTLCVCQGHIPGTKNRNSLDHSETSTEVEQEERKIDHSKTSTEVGQLGSFVSLHFPFFLSFVFGSFLSGFTFYPPCFFEG
jgi:hypothetical protein